MEKSRRGGEEEEEEEEEAGVGRKKALYSPDARP